MERELVPLGYVDENEERSFLVVEQSSNLFLDTGGAEF